MGNSSKILLPVVCFFFFLLPNTLEARETRSEKEQKAKVLRELFLELDLGYLHCQIDCPLAEHQRRILSKWVLLKPLMPTNKKLDAIFNAKADITLWRQARKILEAELFANFTPALTPKASRGKALFSVHCAGCHGESGKSDGPLAGRIKPSLNPLADPSYAEHLSAAMIYNILLTGIPGAPMYSYLDQLGNQDLWDISFFTLTLPMSHSPHTEATSVSQDNSKNIDTQIPDRFKSIRLQDVATYNGREFQSLGFSAEELSFLRLDLTFRSEISK